MSSNIEQLEQQLDSFDAAKCKDALAKLWDLAKGIPTEQVPKLLESWIREVKRKKHIR